MLDTTQINVKGKLTTAAYIDAYFGYNSSQPSNNENPYFVSMHRHNEMTINLAYIDVKYVTERYRARFVPGFGTYINANYVGEAGTLRNVVEGYVGVKLSKKKELWLDIGVLGSPYTNESAISKDHFMYTRSFAPEFVPYYVSGGKLSYKISEKVSAYLYLINGWQVIQDNNGQKSIGTQIEYRPTGSVLINWNTYFGDERSDTNPNFRTRYFSDIYFIFSPQKSKFKGTACAYIGQQDILQTDGTILAKQWWTANIIGQYKVNPKWSVSARLEYFSDPNRAVSVPIVEKTKGLNIYSGSIGVMLQPMDNIFLRFESRSFLSEGDAYKNTEGNPDNQSHWGIANVTIAF
ncbi:MAG: porin [Bacteroidetes bacterium]|nr:MAG: porin [Bacteroidota bacterium]TAG88680.1 MAG: porin [Bacteroidota bacterium]